MMTQRASLSRPSSPVTGRCCNPDASSRLLAAAAGWEEHADLEHASPAIGPRSMAGQTTPQSPAAAQNKGPLQVQSTRGASDSAAAAGTTLPATSVPRPRSAPLARPPAAAPMRPPPVPRFQVQRCGTGPRRHALARQMRQGAELRQAMILRPQKKEKSSLPRAERPGAGVVRPPTRPGAASGLGQVSADGGDGGCCDRGGGVGATPNGGEDGGGEISEQRKPRRDVMKSRAWGEGGRPQEEEVSERVALAPRIDGGSHDENDEQPGGNAASGRSRARRQQEGEEDLAHQAAREEEEGGACGGCGGDDLESKVVVRLLREENAWLWEERKKDLDELRRLRVEKKQQGEELRRLRSEAETRDEQIQRLQQETARFLEKKELNNEQLRILQEKARCRDEQIRRLWNESEPRRRLDDHGQERERWWRWWRPQEEEKEEARKNDEEILRVWKESLRRRKEEDGGRRGDESP